MLERPVVRPAPGMTATATQQRDAHAVATPASARPAGTAVAFKSSMAPVNTLRFASYAEMLPGLETRIAAMHQRLQQQLEQLQAAPADATLVYGVDIVGRTVNVCLACGVIGHTVAPSNQRMENVAIDLMSEGITVFIEAASRAGIRFGVFAVDDEGRLVLRRPGDENSVESRAGLIERFQQFKSRFGRTILPSGIICQNTVVDQAWLARASADWQPADATRKVVGQSDDALAQRTFVELIGNAGSVRGALYMKSVPPAASLRGMEIALKSHRILSAGIAAGVDAALVRSMFFSKTYTASDMHQVCDVQGDAITTLMRRL